MVEQAQFRKVEEEVVVRRLIYADGSFCETLAYSLVEHGPIGEWIDGKPIFRRVFQLVPAANESTLDLTGDTPDWEKWINGYWTGFAFFNFVSVASNLGGVNGLRFNTTNSILSAFHQGMTPVEVSAVIEYTKV